MTKNSHANSLLLTCLMENNFNACKIRDPYSKTVIEPVNHEPIEHIFVCLLSLDNLCVWPIYVNCSMLWNGRSKTEMCTFFTEMKMHDLETDVELRSIRIATISSIEVWFYKIRQRQTIGALKVEVSLISATIFRTVQEHISFQFHHLQFGLQILLLHLNKLFFVFAKIEVS